MCKKWHTTTPGKCSYGDKCQFIHDEMLQPAQEEEIAENPCLPDVPIYNNQAAELATSLFSQNSIFQNFKGKTEIPSFSKKPEI